MKQILKKIYIIIIIILMLFMLTSCTKNNKQTSLEQKINSEISYLDNKLVFIANKLNNIDYDKYKVDIQEIQSNSSNKEDEKSGEGDEKQGSGEKNNQENEKEQGQDSTKIYTMKPNSILGNEEQIDWDDLKNEAENLYLTWTTILIDLKEIGVSNEQLNVFSSNLDMVAISIKNQDKNAAIDNLIKLYESLPEFSKNNNAEKESKILICKYKLLICYKFANTGDEEQFKKSVEDLKMSFSNVQNMKNEYEGKQHNIKSASVIIDEIASSVDVLNNKDIFFVKYKNLMQELNIIVSF